MKATRKPSCRKNCRHSNDRCWKSDKSRLQTGEAKALQSEISEAPSSTIGDLGQDRDRSKEPSLGIAETLNDLLVLPFAVD